MLEEESESVEKLEDLMKLCESYALSGEEGLEGVTELLSCVIDVEGGLA